MQLVTAKNCGERSGPEPRRKVNVVYDTQGAQIAGATMVTQYGPLTATDLLGNMRGE